MSTLILAAAESEMWGGVNHYAIGATVLLILMAALAALVSFGGGREHS
jgi:hypothetical protein